MADKIWPTGCSFPGQFLVKAPKKRFASLSQSLSGVPFAWFTPARSLLLGGLQCPLATPRPSHMPPPWSKNKSTYHMIMITSFITISFKMLKNSTISLACSPIFPMAMPKAMKNPIRPVGWITGHRRTNYQVCVSSPLFTTIPRVWRHILTTCYPMN